MKIQLKTQLASAPRIPLKSSRAPSTLPATLTDIRVAMMVMELFAMATAMKLHVAATVMELHVAVTVVELHVAAAVMELHVAVTAMELRAMRTPRRLLRATPCSRPSASGTSSR